MRQRLLLPLGTRLSVCLDAILFEMLVLLHPHRPLRPRLTGLEALPTEKVVEMETRLSGSTLIRR